MVKLLLVAGLLVILLSMPILGFQLKIFEKKDFQPNLIMFNEIPFKYYFGVKVIRMYEEPIYLKNGAILGLYHDGGVIDLLMAEKKDLIHELAHHQQFLHRERRCEPPCASFLKYYNEINASMVK